MLTRTPEPELMDDPAQARAYACADFSDSNHAFVEHLHALTGGAELRGVMLDLGCGPADICVRLAERHPELRLDAIDGSSAMLDCARSRLQLSPQVAARIRLIEGVLPVDSLPEARYDGVLSNSLLHHLHDPQVLWRCVRRFARRGAPVLVMDLFRPQSEEAVEAILRRYAIDEPAVLQSDFRHSLHAAFTVEEVASQLREAGLSQLDVRAVSDRHLLVSGFSPGSD